jgi:hypothetical protein
VNQQEAERLERHERLMAQALTQRLVGRFVDQAGQDYDPGEYSYCYLCHMWEPREDAHRVCRECGHVYYSTIHLVLTEHEVAAHFDREHDTYTPVHAVGEAEDIGSCPLCGSDW